MQGNSGKNDANDAAAICEAACRPLMPFVPIESAMQRGLIALHSIRERYKEERTACINRIRGVLVESGSSYSICARSDASSSSRFFFSFR